MRKRVSFAAGIFFSTSAKRPRRVHELVVEHDAPDEAGVVALCRGLAKDVVDLRAHRLDLRASRGERLGEVRSGVVRPRRRCGGDGSGSEESERNDREEARFHREARGRRELAIGARLSNAIKRKSRAENQQRRAPPEAIATLLIARADLLCVD